MTRRRVPFLPAVPGIVRAIAAVAIGAMLVLVLVLVLILGRGLFPRGTGPGITAPAMTVRAVDGDTLVLPSGRRARLQGIDAPEKRQVCTRLDGQPWPCGQEAKAALARLVAGGVACRFAGTDRYNRLLALCVNTAGQDVGGAMVRDGWALAYYRYSYAYAWPELTARVARRGVWSGDFIRPADERRSAR
jgi:endonuclease YncB( thermonuclease family)